MDISDEHYLAEGKDRKVYRHPDNPDLCVKIPKLQSRDRRRAWKREIDYLDVYKNRVTCFSFFHGTVESNLGQGYIFDLIKDADGNVSKSLSDIPHPDKLDEKLFSLYQVFLQHGIIVSDLNSGSIVVRRKNDTDYDLLIVDGAGNSDFVKICDFSKYFLKKKLIRKFNKVSKKLKLSLDFNTLEAGS